MSVTIKQQTDTPLFRFMVYYVLWISFLFFLIYFENISPLFFINQLQTDLTVYLTGIWIDFFHIPIVLQGDTLTFTHGLHLNILHDCNGLAAFLFFLAGVLSYPTSKNRKILWIILGYFVILLANTIRLDTILYHVIAHPENFKFIHDILGRYLFAAVPLILFYFYTKKV